MFDQHTYKIIEIVGTSEKSWEEAARRVVETAHRTLKDLRVAEVVGQDLKIEDGEVVLFRVKMKLSFRLHEATA